MTSASTKKTAKPVSIGKYNPKFRISETKKSKIASSKWRDVSARQYQFIILLSLPKHTLSYSVNLVNTQHTEGAIDSVFGYFQMLNGFHRPLDNHC